MSTKDKSTEGESSIGVGESGLRDNSPSLDRESGEKPAISVVLPTLNEEEGVRICIEQIQETAESLGVTTEIIVSDSSTDRTPDIARELGAKVITPKKTGYGNAYKYAFEHVQGDYIVIGDADTTYDFGEFPKLLEVAVDTDADMVLGSRLEGEIRPGAMPALHQYVGNPLLTRFLNTFYDAGVSDAHSGMRVIKRDALEQLNLQSDGMEFASEMIMDAAEKDLKIEEVPITYHERVGDATLESFSDGWRHVKFMMTNAPGYLFTLPSAVFGVLGVFIIAASLQGLQIGEATFGLQTLIVGVLFGIVGYQVGTLALFSSVAADPIRHPNDPITNAVHHYFTLESGATLGVIMFAVSASSLAYSAIAWTITGYAVVPPVEWNLIAMGGVVIGVQTVFNSFFLSLVQNKRESTTPP
jgi:glycosyltransferase involved in cell wall biosynthesis